MVLLHSATFPTSPALLRCLEDASRRSTLLSTEVSSRRVLVRRKCSPLAASRNPCSRHSLRHRRPRGPKDRSHHRRRLQPLPLQRDGCQDSSPHDRRVRRGGRHRWSHSPPRRREEPPARRDPLRPYRLPRVPRSVEGRKRNRLGRLQEAHGRQGALHCALRSGLS